MYKHLIPSQRSLIFAYIQCGKSINFIAEAIGVHKSTVYREIKRNSNKLGRYAHNAQEMAAERQERIAKNASIPKKLKFECLQRIKVDQWSPEQISGAMKKNGASISHTTIYKWIKEDKKTAERSISSCATRGTDENQTPTSQPPQKTSPGEPP